MELIFQVANLAVLPFWLLMILLPHWRITQRVFESRLPLIPLPLLYALLVLPRLGEIFPVLLHPQLEEIARFLGTPEAALVGWLHFLAFDLFVGRWIYLDSRRRQASAFLMAPILLLTLMLGPCGLLVYLAASAWLPPRPPQSPPEAG